MKYRFLVPLYTPTGIIPEGTVLDLTPAQFAQYKGHGNDHLEPVDESPKEPEAPEGEEKPRRGRPPKQE